jgi:NADH-quinone oxidoreductase subunit C
MHKEIADFLNKKVSGAEAKALEAEAGQSSVVVKAEHILKVCEALKDSDEHQFNVLQVISGVDFPDGIGEQKEGVIEVNYMIASFIKNTEFILKIRVPRGDDENLPKVDSVCSVWKAADWQERECYDLVGIDFIGHPDLRRILNVYDWKGHPLRKDYVAQETYQGMTVYPPDKRNDPEMAFVVEQNRLNDEAKAAAKKAKAEAKGESS